MFDTRILLVIGLFVSTQLCAQDVKQDMSVGRQRVLSTLLKASAIDNPKWILGQNAGHENTSPRKEFREYIGGIEKLSGRLPMLIGVDLGYESDPGLQEESVRLLVEHFDRGGLVTLSMHPKNVFRNAGVNDTSTVRRTKEIFEAGSVANLRWKKTLSKAADCIEALQAKGVVVMFRPLHEMNGGWFWWCARNDGNWTRQEDYIRMWREMHAYMTKTRGLDNILWVYAPTVQYDRKCKSVDYFYPGDEFVDVVGLDWYTDDVAANALKWFDCYSKLSALNKPMGLTEFGPGNQRDGTFDSLKLLPLMEKHPRLGFVMFWQSWKGAKVALSDQANAKELIQNPNTLTLPGRN